MTIQPSLIEKNGGENGIHSCPREGVWRLWGHLYLNLMRSQWCIKKQVLMESLEEGCVSHSTKAWQRRKSATSSFQKFLICQRWKINLHHDINSCNDATQHHPQMTKSHKNSLNDSFNTYGIPNLTYSFHSKTHVHPQMYMFAEILCSNKSTLIVNTLSYLRMFLQI